MDTTCSEAPAFPLGVNLEAGISDIGPSMHKPLSDMNTHILEEKIHYHFDNSSFKPNILGLKHIQLMTSANNETEPSAEGLQIWKEHFAEKKEDGNNCFSVNIPVCWFNFIVHLLMTPDKFGWTLHMLKSTLW